MEENLTRCHASVFRSALGNGTGMTPTRNLVVIELYDLAVNLRQLAGQ